jgi:hypothetical protein
MGPKSGPSTPMAKGGATTKPVTSTWSCPLCGAEGTCGDLPRVITWKSGEPSPDAKISLKDVDIPREMDKLCSLVEHLVRTHPEFVITRSKHRMVAIDDCCSTKIKRAKMESVSWPYLEHFMYYHHEPPVHHLQCPLCSQGHTVCRRSALSDNFAKVADGTLAFFWLGRRGKSCGSV